MIKRLIFFFIVFLFPSLSHSTDKIWTGTYVTLSTVYVGPALQSKTHGCKYSSRSGEVECTSYGNVDTSIVRTVKITVTNNCDGQVRETEVAAAYAFMFGVNNDGVPEQCCPQGYANDNTYTQCIPCPSGHLYDSSDVTHHGQCEPYCPHGGPNPVGFDDGICVAPPCGPGEVISPSGVCQPNCTPPQVLKTDDGSCYTPDCPSGQHRASNGECVDDCVSPMIQDSSGQCVMPPCPSGQHRDSSNQCIPDCTPPQVQDSNGQCVDPPCPSGQHKNASGTCIPDVCPPGYTRDGEGFCAPPPCPPNTVWSSTANACVPTNNDPPGAGPPGKNNQPGGDPGDQGNNSGDPGYTPSKPSEPGKDPNYSPDNNHGSWSGGGVNVEVDENGNETGVDNGTGDGDADGDGDESDGSGDGGGGDFNGRWNKVYTHFVNSPLFGMARLMNMPGGGSPVITIEMGSLGGTQTVDFSRFDHMLSIMKIFFLIAVSYACVRIITLKGGGV